MATCLHDISMRFPGGKKKCLTLSYDDGHTQDVRLCELMKKWNIAGTFNINTGMYPPEDTILAPDYKGRLTRSKCKEVYLSAPLFEIATHCYTHPFINKLSLGQVAYEIMEDRKNIEADFGGICRGHAYPYGVYSKDIIDLFKTCGIAYARTTKATLSFNIPDNWLELNPTCHHAHPDLMKLADTFVNDSPVKDPWLFYLWGHSFEFDNNNNWYIIENFFEKVANKEDIWYATNIQVCDYTNAYKSLQFSADGRTIHNPTSIEIFLRCDNKIDLRIAPGDTIAVD